LYVTNLRSIKAKFVSVSKVRNFGREPAFLELKNGRPGGRPSKLTVNHPINAINFILVLVIYALAMSN
jgi:hypothetical protein